MNIVHGKKLQNTSHTHTSSHMKRLQFSGYDQQLRYEVVRVALKRHRAKSEESNNQVRETKDKKKWFKKNTDADAIMFVQATEDELLKKEVQRAADRNKMRLKVTEKVDNTVRKELQRSNPFKGETCGREKCKICQLESGVNCRARGCIYEMQCKECERRYRGQTGNSADERITQHFKDWERKESTCPLYRHSQLYHQGNKFPVSVKILKNCFGDPTTRRITEAVLIDELSSEETMNGKSEWSYMKLNKLSVHQY